MRVSIVLAVGAEGEEAGGVAEVVGVAVVDAIAGSEADGVGAGDAGGVDGEVMGIHGIAVQALHGERGIAGDVDAGEAKEAGVDGLDLIDEGGGEAGRE